MDPEQFDRVRDSEQERDLPASEDTATPDPPPFPGPGAEPRLFQHPPWMVGVTLILAVAAIVAGLTRPVWLLIGSPFILTLALYLGVRLFSSR